MKKYLASILLLCAASLAAQNAPDAPPAGQEQAAPAAPAAESESPSQEGANTMAEAGKFHLGDDPTIWVLILLFILAVVVAIDRIYVLSKNRGDNAQLVQILTENLSASQPNVDTVITQVSDQKFGMEGRVAALALRGWKTGDHAIEEYATAAQIAEKRNLEKRLVVLSTLGNNTPFIGLLGTVLGIMKAFRDLALMGDAGPAVVMKGISEALVATAMGLAVAIPCVIAFNALSKMVKDKLSCSEEITAMIRALAISRKG
jgi:biopolymer transport protein ExbB